MSRGIDIYGIEVLPVKSIKELPQELTERLELPEEALLGSAKLTVTGLSIEAMNRRELLVKGRIQTVEWE